MRGRKRRERLERLERERHVTVTAGLATATGAALAPTASIIMAAPGKTCPRCPERGPQPREAFYANRASRDGLSSYCEACNKALQRERRDRCDREPPEPAEVADVDPKWMAEQQAAATSWLKPHNAYQEKACCYGNGNGQHALSCLFASRTG